MECRQDCSERKMSSGAWQSPKKWAERFIRTLRADSFNVDNELRRRLGPRAVAAIVGIPPSIVSDDGTRMDLSTLMLST